MIIPPRRMIESLYSVNETSLCRADLEGSITYLMKIENKPYSTDFFVQFVLSATTYRRISGIWLRFEKTEAR